MDLTKEFIAEHGLNETQVSAITGMVSTEVANLKKEWDGKANADAEAIINGALKSVVETTGIQREQGQKAADYLKSASEKYVVGSLASAKSALDKKQKELEDSAGDKVLKAEYDALKEKHSELQKKEAEYDRVKQGDFETKYSELFSKNESENIRNAFISVKPSFSDSVNKYEADAKWDALVTQIKSTHNIKFDDKGVAIAIDKENEYKVSKLSELIDSNEDMQELSKGRAQKGLGHQKATIDVDGVPFKVDPNATSAERQKAIKDYLLNTMKYNVISDIFASEFAKYNRILLQKIAK